MVRAKSVNKYKNQKLQPFYKKGIFYFVCLSIFFAYLCWIWNKIYIQPHRFDFLVLSANGELRKILNGETIVVHPMDRIKIIDIITNVPFNLYVRLFSKKIDIMAFKYEELALISLFPEKDIYKRYRFRVHVKFKNQELGYIDCIVQPFFEDWLKRLQSIKDLYKKKNFLNKGFSLFPEEKTELIRLKIELAHLFEKKKLLNEAVREYEDVLKYSDQMDHDTLLSIYETLGNLCTKLKRYKDAIKYYELAIDIGEKAPEIYYNIYKLYKLIGSKSKANSYLAKLLKLKPEDTETKIEFAKLLLERGDIDEANEYISEVLKFKPDCIDALVLKAKVLDKKGDKKGLIRIYKKILNIEPENKTILYNLAILEYELNNMDKALSYLKKYIKKEPKDKDAHELLFQIYKVKKMEEMAFEEAKNLISISPQLIYPYYFIFHYLWPKGRCDEIISFVNKGLRYNPKNIALREYLVLCYLNKGKDALAMKHVKYILKLKPNDINTLLQLAKILEKRGNYFEALRIYKKILIVAPTNEEAQNGYLRLRLKRIEEKGGN